MNRMSTVRGLQLGRSQISDATSEIDVGLQQLIALWIDGTPASLRLIPLLCSEMAEFAAGSGFKGFSPALLHRVTRLSGKADLRFAALVEILCRTGSYSRRGAQELLPRIVTAGWEG